MNYTEAIDWLYSRVANYQQVGGSAYKPGLEKIISLLDRFDNPHKDLKCVHIAGTNGKGSVAHIMASALQECGYKVGIFTSPHIKDFRERIKINGKPVSEESVLSFLKEFQANCSDIDASFFEVTTAMAFQSFKTEAVDIAIIETGLGGRLDATNVVDPILSVITNIGLEHTEYLGDTLAEIAGEKGGIIKQNRPVVIGEMLPETEGVFRRIASDKSSELIEVLPNKFESDLLGTFQQKNLSTAWTALKELEKHGWEMNEESILDGFKKVCSNTGFAARLQLIQFDPKIIVDAAHNPEGMRTVIAEIMLMDFDQLHIVFGASKDKDIQEMLSAVPRDAELYLTTFGTERSASGSQLGAAAQAIGMSYTSFDSSAKAKEAAQTAASSDDIILICGSFFLLEEIL